MNAFVRAVDLGSFAAAAAELGISGPMVGKHVRFLEDRLGVRLLNRTTRRQSLTEAGRAYHERCRVVLAEAAAADALASEAGGEPRGLLRVTAPVHFGRRCVAPVLSRMLRDYPALELEISLTDRFLDLAEDGYDLAIRTGTLVKRGELVTRRVARQHMVVCAAPAYLAQAGRPSQVHELAGHEGIVYRRLGRVAPWLFTRDKAPPVEVTPRHRMRLDDLDAIADAATSGLGLAWLPSWLVRERIAAGELEPLLADEPGFPYDCHALWTQTPHLPRKVRLAVDALAAALPRMMT